MTHPLLPTQAASRRLALIVIPLLLVLSLAATCPAVPTPPPASAPTPALPADLSATPRGSAAGQLDILPYLSAFLDTDGDRSVEEVAAPGMLSSFRPLHPRTLPRSSGVTWLRLEIPAAGAGRPAPLVLDLGQGVPAGAVLYTPGIDPLSRQTTWQEDRANWRNLLCLPLPGETPQICYIRLDGQPPLWFAPTLRSLDNLASAPESLLGPGVMLALAVVMLLALLRGITERGQWRFWTALYVGAALTHAVLGGPDLGAGNITPADAVSAMAPGLALMFLAHLARHLMQTASHSRLLDIQYLLLSLPGAVLALLPLWPDFSWMGRYLPLWPMLALIFVPTTLGAWLMGVPGARRFLLGCLVAALGAGLAVLDFGTLLPPFVQGTLPLWGTALSALIIAGMSAPGRETETAAAGPADPPAPDRSAQSQTITDPNLRLLDTEGNTLPLMTGLSQPAPAPATVEADSASATAIRRLEQALAVPLRELVEQNRQLEQCSLPHDVRSRVEGMGRRARQALRLLHDPAGDAAAPAAPAPTDGARAATRAFDLRRMLQKTHEHCRALAEKSGIALGWHVPSDLEQRYEGPAGDLEETLRLLLEDAVRASKGGKVHFAVRHVPDSKHPGHLLFQVRDTGTGLPPEQRSAPLLARIWELSSAHGGFLGVESGPRGTSVIFTLQLQLPEASADDLPTVLVCAPDAATRRELGAMLRDLPCTCRETGTLAHGLAAGARRGGTPATVLLVCGPEASVEAAPMLRRYHGLAERTGPFGAVALTPDQSQWDELANAGFSHALTLPVSEDALRETVLEILGSHDDVADLGAPLPETRQADAPLPDLFGPVAAPQADQGMPDLLLSTDDMPERTVPAAQAATGGDLPDLFAAPASAGAEAAPAAPLSLTDDMRRDAPVAPVAQTARPEAEQPLPADDEQSGAVRADAASASAADAAQPVAPAPADSPVQENDAAPEAAEDDGPAPAPTAPDFPSVPVAAMDDAATQEAPLEEEKEGAPTAEAPQEEALPQQGTADAAAAPADGPAVPSGAADSTEEAVAETGADADMPGPAQDEAAEVPPSAPAFPAPAQEAEAEQPLPADDRQNRDVRAEAAKASAADDAQPVAPAPADSPVQENGAAPEAAEDDGPAPAPTAPDFPSVPVAAMDDAATQEAPLEEEKEEAPTAEAPQEEALPQQGTADAAAPADGPAASSDAADSTEEAVAETGADADMPSPAQDEAAEAPRPAPAFPSADAARPLASGYVSPSLRHAGEWVDEPMPIGTPVSRPVPRREEAASAPVETVVTVRPLRRDVSPDEIARKLGKPSLVPTDKSALITPPPRKGPGSGPAAGTQPAFPGAPVEEAPHAVPGSKDVSSLPDMTPDSTTLLASGREETSRTRAAANTLMRFLSRFHTGSSQPRDDREEDKGPQAPAATVQERQGTPRPIPKKEGPQQKSPEAAAEIPTAANPWIERRTAPRPAAPAPRVPVPPMPQRPQPPDDPEDPLPALMWRMDKYLAEAGYALEQRRLHLVADAAGRLAAEAESYGFRVLGRMARCVESAGRAKDLQAVTDLLPELATAVERHRISLGS
ncbi:7TM diverse intracellular signaling domain-containing protein [uncultured Desulfovibrio sp.]|uniref:7TM diverse intracellular signaling domain-containing protein n=1 Tax=uncultured Desulfovibrio sp. TaxID=167968 RepID=UPI0025F4AF16|nr:7TM diverse intracellular signaling domain-containing protein [uncultured Desulfovibrio sp.]